MSHSTTAVDISAIHTALLTYSIAIDSRDLDLFDQCFAPEATVEIGGMGTFTVAEWAAISRESFQSLDATHHLLSIPALRIDGDTAHARTYFTAQHTRSALADAPHFTIGGWYDDTLERRDGSWRIVRKRGASVWAEGNPEVLGGGFPRGAVPRGAGHDAPAWLRDGAA